MEDAQARVAAFLDAHDAHAAPEYRLLDLASEVGELAKAAAESTGYGAGDDPAVPEDELGDALFALLAAAEAFDHDAEAALATAIEKYERRAAASGSLGSGE